MGLIEKLQKKKLKYLIVLLISIGIVLVVIVIDLDLLTPREEWKLIVVNTSNEKILIRGSIYIYGDTLPYSHIYADLDVNESKSLRYVFFDKTYDIFGVNIYAGNYTKYFPYEDIDDSETFGSYKFLKGELYDLVAVVDTSDKNITFSKFQEFEWDITKIYPH